MKPINYLVDYQRNPIGNAPALPFAPFPGKSKVRWVITNRINGPVFYKGKPSKQAWRGMVAQTHQAGSMYLTVIDRHQKICAIECFGTVGFDWVSNTPSTVLLEKVFGHRRRPDILKALRETYGV